MTKSILAAGLAVLVILCACSGIEQNGGQEPDIEGKLQAEGSVGLNWQITETKLPAMAEPDNMPEGTWMDEIFCGMAGETIYGLGGVTVRESEDRLYHVGYVVEKMEYPYEKWDICMYKGIDEWLENESCTLWGYPWSIVLSRDGTLSMLLDGEESTWLCRWKDGEDSWRLLSDSKYYIPTITKEDLNDDGIKDMFVDVEGNIYFANFNGSTGKDGVKDVTCLFAEQAETGGIGKSIAGAGTVLYLQENPYVSPEYFTDGTIFRDFYLYMFGNTPDGGFYIQDCEKNEAQLIDDTITMEEGDKAVWESMNSGYLCNSTRIWKFETDTGLVQEAVYLPDYGYLVDRVLDCRMTEDEKLVLLVLAEGRHMLLELDGDVNAGKTTIELAVCAPDAVLKQAVVRFNRQNKEYMVELRTAEDGETKADFVTRIQAQLAAGAGPDLLADDVIADMEAMAGKKQLMELTEFFGEEDMLSNVWECGKVGDDLYAVPYTYSIQTLVTTKEMAGDRTGWTAEELMQCVRASGVKQFCSSFGGDTMFWHLCGGDGIDTDIMDWENGICHFDSRQARELLEFAAEYNGEVDYVMNDIKVLEGDSFAGWGQMYSPASFSSMICVYQDGQVYIGYPTAEGGSGHILDPDMVALNPATEHGTGAVDFLQYLVSEDIQEYMAEKLCNVGHGISFPVRRAALEHLYEYLLNVPPEDEEEAAAEEEMIYYEYGIGTAIGDYEFLQMPFTEENVGQMRRVIETASPRRSGSLTIYDIISEETESFFKGNKSAEEVLAVVQNRIQLYLDEKAEN